MGVFRMYVMMRYSPRSTIPAIAIKIFDDMIIIKTIIITKPLINIGTILVTMNVATVEVSALSLCAEYSNSVFSISESGRC